MPTDRPVDRFLSPDPSFAPIPFWWWSGDVVTAERIDWQLRRFLDGGIRQLVVINLNPRGPGYSGSADEPLWFTDQWWELFGHACATAERLDMRLWFYDQIGFSTANIPGAITQEHPWAAGQRVVVGNLRDGGPAAFGEPTFLTAYDSAGNRYGFDELEGLSDRDTDIRVISTRRTSFDFLNPSATDLLIDYVHGEFERRLPQYLGNVIAGSFQDELPPINSWTPGLPDVFRERHGYDLLDELPALFTAGDDRAAKIRTDYYAVRTAMAEEALFRPLSEWHQKRGMLIGADQANPARSGFPTQATQLYSDYFRTHRWYSAVGSDHQGDAKVHSSMAHLYGHERVWMEAFHSAGWGSTLEETYDWLIPFVRSGADLYNPHASYYGTFGGWFEWAPPSTDWRQPYWGHYRTFSDAVARLCSVANWGRFVASVAVLHPTTVAQALVPLDVPASSAGDAILGAPFEEVDRTQRTYVELCGRGNWFTPEPGALDAAGIAFDIVDDHSVQSSTRSEGRIAVRDQRYRVVVLPSATVLEPATAAALVDLLEHGGTVLAVGALPRLEAGTQGDESVAALVGHPRLRTAATVNDAVTIIQEFEDGPRSDVPLLVKESDDTCVALVTAIWPSATEHISRHKMQTVKKFDRARYETTRTVRIPGPVAAAEVWDPATGTRTPIDASATVDGTTTVDVPLDGAPAVFLVWRRTGGPADPAPSPRTPSGPATAPVPGTPHPGERTVDLTEWTGTLLPTLDNQWGDLARPAGADIERLQIWSFDWAETSDSAEPAEDAWQQTRVTFGQRIKTFGPAPVGELPAPLEPDQIAAIADGHRELADDSWSTYEYSSSRGRERELGQLGNKGLVYEEFVQLPLTDHDEGIVVRTIIGNAPPGAADLVVGAGAVKRVWWNGREVTPGSQDYYAVARVDVGAGPQVLEYRLGTNENGVRKGLPTELGSFFALTRPDSFPLAPRFVSAGAVEGDVRLTYRTEFDSAEDTESVRLVVGANATTTVRLDGHRLAVQARSELYEDQTRNSPRFFSHDLSTILQPGRHTLELEVEAFPGADYVYADLALRSGAGTVVVGTDESWTVTGPDGVTTPVQVRSSHWGELASTRVARRPHPLPDAGWLRGQAEVGDEVMPITATDTAAAATQWYRITLPSGATEVTVPLGDDAEIALPGDVGVTRTDDGVVFAQPLRDVTTMIVRLRPRAFRRAGTAWTGPLQVTVAAAARIPLGDWRSIGLSAWSGGVAYRCVVDPAVIGGGDLVLDLGHVRGTVEVQVEGTPLETRFCGPFRFALGTRNRPFELVVRVYNTLGPFLYESTPTRWVLTGQLESGLVGPVTLTGADGPSTTSLPHLFGPNTHDTPTPPLETS